MASKPFNKLSPIPKKLIDEMIQEYKNTLHKLSSASLQKRFPGRTFSDGTPLQDSFSTWVSKEDLMRLLDENKGDGIRFYFGCHSRSTAALLGEEYLGMLALCMVATKSSELRKGGEGIDQLREMPENAESIESKSDTFTKASLGSFEGNGGDMTTLCPPRCPK